MRGTRVEFLWRQSMSETIGGGTCEIMRGLIARNALGLAPRLTGVSQPVCRLPGADEEERHPVGADGEPVGLAGRDRHRVVRRLTSRRCRRRAAPSSR